MQWRVGSIRTDLADSALSAVEEKGRCAGPSPEGIDGASVLSRADAGHVGLSAHEDLFPDSFRLPGLDRRSTDHGIEETRRSEGVVTDHPRGKPKARGSGEKSIVWIPLSELRGGVATLAERLAGNKESKNMAGIPIVLHQFDGKPIEELGVGRCFSLQSEIFRGSDEPFSKDKLPEMIGNYAGGQGVLRRHQPFGKIQSVEVLSFGKREDGGGNIGLDHLSFSVPDTTFENVGTAGFLALAENVEIQFPGAFLKFAKLPLGIYRIVPD